MYIFFLKIDISLKLARSFLFSVTKTMKLKFNSVSNKLMHIRNVDKYKITYIYNQSYKINVNHNHAITSHRTTFLFVISLTNIT